MGHRISHDVDSQGICFLDGEFLKIPLVVAFSFPAVTEVCIVTNEDHDAAVVVFNRLVVWGTCIRWSRFPSNSLPLPPVGNVDRWDLWFLR